MKYKHIKIKKNIHHIIKNCGNLKSKEKCLILYDKTTIKIADSFFKECKKFSMFIKKIKVKYAPYHGQSLSKSHEKLMCKSDLILCLTKYSIFQGESRLKASKSGARFLSLAFYNNFTLTNPAVSVDYKPLKKLTDKFANIFTKGNYVKIETDNGNSILYAKILKRVGNSCPGVVKYKGDCGSPPDVEANVSPVENFTYGEATVTGSVADENIGVLKDKIKFVLKKGGIREIQTKNLKLLKSLNKIFKNQKSKKRILGEIGVGLNPKAKISGNMLIDEGSFGVVHLGFGANSSSGGKNRVNFHLDFMMPKSSLFVDNKKIIDKGRIVI